MAAFNIADSAISVGVGMLILVTLLKSREEKTSREMREE
jgi:lipoprotein signal peptidase